MKKSLTIRCKCGKGMILEDAFKKNGELRKATSILVNLFKHFHVGEYCEVSDDSVASELERAVRA